VVASLAKSAPDPPRDWRSRVRFVGFTCDSMLDGAWMLGCSEPRPLRTNSIAERNPARIVLIRDCTAGKWRCLRPHGLKVRISASARLQNELIGDGMA
jgi:hypothetical protein